MAVLHTGDKVHSSINPAEREFNPVWGVVLDYGWVQFQVVASSSVFLRGLLKARCCFCEVELKRLGGIGQYLTSC